MGTLADASYHPLPEIEATPPGSVVTIRKYCVFQFHVMLVACAIVKVTLEPSPELGTLPVPVHPVHTY